MGNAGNGASPEPPAVIDGAGSQILTPADEPEAAQNPGTPTAYGNFNVTELGDTADKSGKDNNYRGLTVYDGVVYLTKGSGSNGVDTVYFVDPNGIVQRRQRRRPPVDLGDAAEHVELDRPDLQHQRPGSGPDHQEPGPDPDERLHPEGLPDRHRQERDGRVGLPVRPVVRQPDHALRGRRGRRRQHLRRHDQHLHRGRRFDDRRPAEVVVQLVDRRMAARLRAAERPRPGHALRRRPRPRGDQYPTGLNNTDSGTGLPWAPATDGLRNLTGRVNRNGTVSLWASTSTVSGSGDQGADPNKLVEITDNLGATSASQVAHERFHTVMQATYGQVVRGVSFTPGTPLTNGNNTSPQPSLPPARSRSVPGREQA